MLKRYKIIESLLCIFQTFISWWRNMFLTFFGCWILFIFHFYSISARELLTQGYLKEQSVTNGFGATISISGMCAFTFIFTFRKTKRVYVTWEELKAMQRNRYYQKCHCEINPMNASKLTNVEYLYGLIRMTSSTIVY